MTWEFKTGGYAYLSREIVEPATGDHPAFLMGAFAEKVKIIEKTYGQEFLVEGPSNPGKPWFCETRDLMFTKPFKGNQ